MTQHLRLKMLSEARASHLYCRYAKTARCFSTRLHAVYSVARANPNTRCRAELATAAGPAVRSGHFREGARRVGELRLQECERSRTCVCELERHAADVSARGHQARAAAAPGPQHAGRACHRRDGWRSSGCSNVQEGRHCRAGRMRRGARGAGSAHRRAGWSEHRFHALDGLSRAVASSFSEQHRISDRACALRSAVAFV